MITMIKIDVKGTGHLIKVQMVKRGLSTDRVAKELGYSDRSTINRWTRGESMPSYENLINLAILLRCDLKDIVAYEKD